MPAKAGIQMLTPPGAVVIFNVIPVKTGIQMLFEPLTYFGDTKL